MRTVHTGIGLALSLYVCSGAAATVFPTGPHAAFNVIPFGNAQVGSHHQVFASTLFSTVTGGAPAQITAIALAPGVNGVYNADVVVRLGYTTATPGTAALLAPASQSGGGAPNATGPMTDFFVNHAYSATFTGFATTNFQMVLAGTPFIYDPSQGNLLVEFVVNVPGAPNIDLSLSRAAGSAESSRAYNTTRFGATGSPTTALRMDFTFTTATPSVIYTNCNLSTGPTTLSGVAAPAGSTWSECADGDPPNQAQVQNTTAGFSLSGAFRLADDFVVPTGGRYVSSIKFPVYTTGAVTVTTTGVTLQILDGSPAGTPNVVFGDTTTNRMASAEFSTLYRCFNTHNGPACAGLGTAPGTTRHIQWAYATVNQFLPAGTYWLNWNVIGGTFAPSTTEADAVGRSCGGVVGNGLQLNGTWLPANDAGQGCTPTPVQMDHYFEVVGFAPPTACYANCDSSTQNPFLNVADFTCFLTKFAANDPYANCDASTTAPVLNVADFTCFLTKFAAGCSAP